MWKNTLMEVCKNLNIEPVIERDKIFFVCSRIPVDKNKITSILPDGYICEFVEGIKPSTINLIKITCIQHGIVYVNIKEIKQGISLRCANREGSSEEDSLDSTLCTILAEDGYTENFEITLNNSGLKNYNIKILKILSQHRVRETYIKEEDMTDLRIILETSKSSEDLINQL
jgi:hypothetical protein